MQYKTFTIDTELAAFIKCFWTLEGSTEEPPSKQRIVPDGCMEMIFHYGDQYRQYKEDGKAALQPRCFVFGQITTPLDIEPSGATGIFAIRFYPEGFSPFPTLPTFDMENRAVPLEELYGAEGLQLEKEILQAAGTAERIAISKKFLQNRLSRPESIDLVVRSSVASILEMQGQLSITALSQQINVNRRQLERKFSSVIGLSPKQLSKIIRIQATLKMLLNKQFSSLTAVAYEGDYYDQAHFIKDFKEFTGMSPKKFYADNLKLSSLFYGME